MGYPGGTYDVAVIGAGHAGIEAALAAARLGCRTAVFATNLDLIGNMPCNPSIGGTAKGHLVCEIDALGGEMAKGADANLLQSRMLNRAKGPAVHSLRAQIDRRGYSNYMKHALERQENLEVRQAEIVHLERSEEGWLVRTLLDADYRAACVILATGTFLGGRVYVGEVHYPSGPDGAFPANRLSESLKLLGLPLRRFKTGTPARVLRGSICFDQLEVQHGDETILPFSFSTTARLENKVVCHLAYTNERTKQVIQQNLRRSPLFSGAIEGVGPRYCPSIEDKIVRFPDKPRHTLFIEPCGLETEEMYLQGMSSSLPEDVQIALYRTIRGLEKVQIMRNAYAIEYDCVDPLALRPTLEFKDWPGLFGAGQFNGSSGYEEAAAQGLVAGINAARRVKGQSALVLDRASSYIGTLIDDLVTKGCNEPYRMMTSRSEYRLLLRQDNADDRLMRTGREIGLIGDDDWAAFMARSVQTQEEIERCGKTIVRPSDSLNALLAARGSAPVTAGVKLSELLRRPRIDYDSLAPFDSQRPALNARVRAKVEIEIKYEGYLKRQAAQVAQMRRLETMALPRDFDYIKADGLRLEAREKLQKIRPLNLGQASRISGVSPADISVLMVLLEKRKRESGQ